jgi:predicted methyltransferase
MRKLLFAAALAAMPMSALHAVPADVATAVSAPGRPTEATALDAGRHPVEVLRFMGLRRGDRAVDLFTDNGYYGEIMARAVGPRGSVLGWNPREFTGNDTTQAEAAVHSRSANYAAIVTPGAAIALPSQAFDFAMLHLNYHDTYLDYRSRTGVVFHMEPPQFLATVFQSLKPGGTIAVIDHVANAGGETRAVVRALHRIDPATLRADFERAGFGFDGELALLRNPDDDHSKNVFDPAIRGHTDRIVYRFRRPR